MENLNDTAHKLLDVAESRTQLYGFNAFSYKDLQAEVGIKTSSIHYYFPTKQDLAFAIIKRYIERFHDILRSISKNHYSGVKRLYALGDVYITVVKQNKFCLCGMLASDSMSLSDNTILKLKEFFILNEAWIADAIELAQKQEGLKSSVDAKKAAPLFLAMLEGAMLIARLQKHAGYLESAIKQAITQMKE